MPLYLTALAVTLAAELPIIAGVYAGERLRMAAVCLVATSATNLAMHLWLVDLMPGYQAWLLAGECMALVLEAVVYALASREYGWPRAMVASALANSASFLAGLLIW